MTRIKRFRKWALGLAVAGTTFVTAASCDPYTGFLDFYRDDDSDDYFYDDVFFDGGFYYDDPYFYDPYYDGCFFCF